MCQWIRRSVFEHAGSVTIDFFWVALIDGSVDLAYGDPVGNAVVGCAAGDREGLCGQDIGPFEMFAWLETPMHPHVQE